MVNGIRIPIWNRTKEPLGIALIEVGRGLKGRDMGAKQLIYNISLISIVTVNPPM
jgi:hypothetical protein